MELKYYRGSMPWDKWAALEAYALASGMKNYQALAAKITNDYFYSHYPTGHKLKEYEKYLEMLYKTRTNRPDDDHKG